MRARRCRAALLAFVCSAGVVSFVPAAALPGVPADIDLDATVAQMDAYGDAQFLQPLRDAGWVCGDGFISLGLPDGRIMWIFADSLIDDGRFVNNAVAVSEPRADGTVGFRLHSGADRHGFIELAGTPLDTWYWPATPLPQVQDRFVHLTAVSMVRNDDAAPGFQFRSQETRILSYRYSEGSLEYAADSPTPVIEDWSGSPIAWGAAVGYDSEHAYLYGIGAEPDSSVWGHAVYLARVDVRRLSTASVTGFEVRTHTGWASPAGLEVGQLLQLGSGFSSVFEVSHQANGDVIAAVKTREFLGDSIDLYRADQSGGVFERVRSLAVLPTVPEAFTYWVKAHPELPSPPGLVWASSNNNHVSGQLSCSTGDPATKPIFYLLPAFIAPAPASLEPGSPDGTAERVKRIRILARRTRARIAWAKAGAGSHYRVKVRRSRTHSSWRSHARPIAKVKGLRPGGRYAARVRVVNEVGEGPIAIKCFRTLK